MSTKNMFDLWRDSVGSSVDSSVSQSSTISKHTTATEDDGEVVIKVTGGASGRITSTKYSQSQIEDMLEGYTMAPRDTWG